MTWVDQEGEGGPPGKSQMTLGYLRNSGTDHPREVIRPPRREVHTAFCKMLGCIKQNKTSIARTNLTKFT